VIPVSLTDSAARGIGVSQKQLDEFLKRLAEDDSLRGECGDGQVSAESIVALAAEHGFQITSGDLLMQARPLADDEWADAARRFDCNHSDCYILFLEEAPMSKDALNAFFKKVADDEALQSKLIEFAAAQGFEFSSEELSDSDLDTVAGGLLSFAAPSKIDYKLEDMPADKIADLTADKIAVFPKVEDLGR
jgi:predicted ribosomally synthesized peptide with nif11-like leader